MCGLDARSLKTLYDKHGDAGDVAFEAKKRQNFTLRKPKPLTIKGVYQSLVKIAKTQGIGSNEIKQRVVDRLLQDARGAEESRYVVRTLCQHVSHYSIHSHYISLPMYDSLSEVSSLCLCTTQTNLPSLAPYRRSENYDVDCFVSSIPVI